ncbi:membrane protein [Paractinoplanes abujensis]|uniref:Membrane protease YdiL (CAAX protease family) n=1 Tax=Paractinoplanes abujensis TaxID=882441 RepID=A0A7W7CQR7_9ACTN|nr:acyltransferase [Actinoplanes abujensis]MBB4693001.1 membrane protease YdiL (CAAX protease family) [Actinoplanes abujensis]GID22495.1 membrane protein [Actinoplanes abujensis]
MSWTTRIAAATPEHRDRTIDALRAVAIVGVILGHWLVSAVVSDPQRPAAWHGASPLSGHPALVPATWVLQTLGLFFFAGGYSAARSLGGKAYRPWLTARLTRLARPVAVLFAVWVPVMLVLRLTAVPGSTRRLVQSLITHPMWFLLVFVVLTALTPLLREALFRYGLWAALPLVALVAVSDVQRWNGLVAPAGWAVPYLLGIALAEGRLPRRAGAILGPAGAVAGAVLVLGLGYPAGAVGVPGDGRSNLNPPTLFALALAATQIGMFLLLRPWLAGRLRRPAVWAPVVLLNLAAMTLFCWHQSALLLVTAGGLLAGPLPGLHDAPVGAWPLHRLVWLPLFALVLAGLWTLVRRGESGPASARVGAVEDVDARGEAQQVGVGDRQR